MPLIVTLVCSVCGYLPPPSTTFIRLHSHPAQSHHHLVQHQATALHVVAGAALADTVALLLKAKADFNAKDDIGSSACGYDVVRRHRAAYHHRVVASLPSSSVLAFAFLHPGETPLHYAVKGEHSEDREKVVLALLKAGYARVHVVARSSLKPSVRSVRNLFVPPFFKKYIRMRSTSLASDSFRFHRCPPAVQGQRDRAKQPGRDPAGAGDRREAPRAHGGQGEGARGWRLLRDPVTGGPSHTPHSRYRPV